jgi:superfamily II DNA/RNA helicase
MEQEPVDGFESIAGLEVTPEFRKAFAEDGISAPTPIQRAVIPPIVAGQHVVVGSGTGTGKTLAYLLPVLQKVRLSPAERVVCLAPSAELAVQTLRVAERYRAPATKVVGLVAGGNQRDQKSKLQKSTQLLVGTPGRVLELFSQRKLKGVTTLVLDESEPILTTKGADYLREILSRPEPKVQLIFAAATFGARAERWIEELMGEAVVRPVVDDDPLRDQITHGTLRVGNESLRDRCLARFIEDNRCDKAIVFVNQPNLLRHLFRFLSEQGLKPVSVSSERTKQQNRAALIDFRSAKAKVLLTTDNAATGLDVPDVGWVLHYELPSSPEGYVHRAGRTGRAGRQGCSVVLLGAGEQARFERMARTLKLKTSAF